MKYINMKMKLTIFLSFFWLAQLATAQKTHELTVDKAVKMALENGEDIKNLKLDVQIQEAMNKEIKGTALPQVTGTGQATYYTNLPQVQFPNSNIGIYDVLSKEGVQDRSGNPINTSNASFSVQEVAFVAPFSFNFGVGVQQLLFQPDVFVALKARAASIQYANNNIAIAEDKVKESVQKAYYSVLIAEKQKTILEETLQRLVNLTNEMTQMYNNGFAEKLDIEKLTVTQNNTITSANQLTNAISINKALLKNTLGVPMQDTLVLVDQLETDEMNALLIMGEDNFNYELRSEIGLLNTAQKLQDLDIERQKLSIYPTVAAFYTLQRQGQRNPAFAPPGQTPWFFFNTGLIGLSVNQPIFDGFQRKYKIAQSKLKADKVVNNITQVKRAIDMEQDIARNSLSNAILNLKSQEGNVTLAKDVFETTKKKYAAGLGSSLELIQADTELQRAQGNYFQSLYDCYIANVSYKKSLGKL